MLGKVGPHHSLWSEDCSGPDQRKARSEGDALRSLYKTTLYVGHTLAVAMSQRWPGTPWQ